MLDSTAILLAITISFIAIFVVIAFLMGFFRKMLNIGAYMGPNATIFAIGAKYTEKDNIEKLLSYTNINEVIADIEKEGYVVEDLRNYDIQLETSMLKMMKRVLEMLPDDGKSFAEAYMLKYDANIVKRVLRAKYAKVPKARIYENVYEGRYITKMIIQHMVEATNMEDAVTALDVTPFAPVIQVWNETNDLYKVEIAIDKIVLANLINSKRILDENAMEPANIFLSVFVDIYNIKTVVRAKNAEIEDISDLIVEGGYELSDWKVKSMANARSLDEALSYLEGTSYAHLRDINDPFKIELELDRFLLKKVNEIGLTFSTTAGPLIMFLVSKDFEVRNLKAILKGYMENISKEKIREILVGDAP